MRWPAIFNKKTPTSDPAFVAEVQNKTPDQRNVKTVQSYLFKQQLKRLRQDLQSWRLAIDEVEQPWFPQRVKLQQLFQDTVLNGHVHACMEKRKRLTMLKKFCVVNGSGKELEEWTKFLEKKWFNKFMNYVLDARAYGYTLIALGDIVNDTFPNLETVRRYNVSPERLQIQQFMYSITGLKFTDETIVDDYGNRVSDWLVWVDTISESGVNKCGNGYLYKVALYEIMLRNVLGFNADFVELFAQPYRVGKTDKTEGDERDKLEESLQQMGSSGYAIIDLMDSIEFIESKQSGTGYKSYESLEKRCEEKISKIILGHATAMDKTPGKLGNDQEVHEAMEEVQKEDNRFFCDFMNEVFLQKLRVLGFNIPMDARFEFKNDKEEQEHIAAVNTQNKQVAEVAKIMKEAGMKIDVNYFVERTGIPFEEIEEPSAPPANVKFGEKVKNSLNKLYGKED